MLEAFQAFLAVDRVIEFFRKEKWREKLNRFFFLVRKKRVEKLIDVFAEGKLGELFGV